MKHLLPAAALTALLLCLPGCGIFTSPEDKVVAAYVAYRTALSAGDVKKSSKFLASPRAREISADPKAREKLRLLAFMMPGTMTVMGVTVTDRKASLTLREGSWVNLAGGSPAPALGPVPALASARATGTVDFVKERWSWKIEKESWDHDTGANPFQFVPARPFYREGEPLPKLQKTIGREGGTQLRGSVALSPDGASLVTASYGDFTVSRWRVADGSEMATVKMDYRPVTVELTPDGQTAITLDAYGGITFWPLTPEGFGTPVRVETEGRGQDIAISRNGRFLAMASFSEYVSIWDIATKKELARAIMPTPMRSVAFSPTGQLLAAGSTTNAFTLWDLETGAGRTYTIPKVAAKSDVSGIAFSPDGKRLATAHMDSSITLWNVPLQREIKNFFVPQSSSWRVRFSPDGTLFATATQGGSIHLWHADTGTKLGSLQGQPSQPQGLAFSTDGTLLFSAGERGEIAVWGKE